jgi:hypothetical protein
VSITRHRGCPKGEYLKDCTRCRKFPPRWSAGIAHCFRSHPEKDTMTKPALKFCRDCAYRERSFIPRFFGVFRAKCFHPKALDTSPAMNQRRKQAEEYLTVTGKKRPVPRRDQFVTCDAFRKSEQAHCGPKGLYYEAFGKKPWFFRRLLNRYNRFIDAYQKSRS